MRQGAGYGKDVALVAEHSRLLTLLDQFFLTSSMTSCEFMRGMKVGSGEFN